MAANKLQKLNGRHRLFVEAYEGAGDESRAAMIAGYNGTEQYLKQYANKLLEDPKIIDALEYRNMQARAKGAVIASREERQQLWSELMRNDDPYAKTEVDKYGNTIEADNKNIPISIRMKAMELLAKSEGDFVDRVEINSAITIESEILKSYKIEESTHDIEAAYRNLDAKQIIDRVKSKREEEDEEEELTFEGLI